MNQSIETLKSIGTVLCGECLPEVMKAYVFRSGFVPAPCPTCKKETEHIAVDVDAFTSATKEHILIPQDLCKNVEIGHLVQYGDETCIIIGATVGYAIGGKLTLKPWMDVKKIGDGSHLGRKMKTREEILGDMPKDFVPMYGPLIVSTMKSNTGKARVMVWQYTPVERLTEEFETAGEAESEAARVLYILEKHGVRARRPVGAR